MIREMLPVAEISAGMEWMSPLHVWRDLPWKKVGLLHVTGGMEEQVGAEEEGLTVWWWKMLGVPVQGPWWSGKWGETVGPDAGREWRFCRVAVEFQGCWWCDGHGYDGALLCTQQARVSLWVLTTAVTALLWWSDKCLSPSENWQWHGDHWPPSPGTQHSTRHLYTAICGREGQLAKRRGHQSRALCKSFPRFQRPAVSGKQPCLPPPAPLLSQWSSYRKWTRQWLQSRAIDEGAD